MNILLAVTADTWIVTGLGFGIVLALLVCLIYILKFFGFVMQKATGGCKKEAKAAQPARVEPKTKVSPVPTDEGTMAAIAMALHLYYGHAHDFVDTTLTMTAKPTAWNSKVFGMNNAGF